MSGHSAIADLTAPQFPPPDGVILSNLVNRLIENPNLYTRVLSLAKDTGYSSIYECKTVVPPVGGLLSGYFQWVTTEENENENIEDLQPEAANDSECSTLKTARRSFPSPKLVHRIKTVCRRDLIDIKLFTKLDLSGTSDISIRKETLGELPIIDADLTIPELAFRQVKVKDFDHFPILKSYKPGKPYHKLYVKNISKSVSKKELVHVFHGFVKELAVSKPFDIRYFERGKLRGQAFVTLPSKRLAVKARRATNGLMLKGKPIVVVFGKDRH